MSESTITTTPVQEKVLGIIAEELELDPSEFTRTGHFVDDYDADSLALIAIVARIEKEVGVLIQKTELASLVNLDAVFARVESSGEAVAERA